MNYIGSKYSIMDFIVESTKRIVNKNAESLVFCDVFSGTSSVGRAFKNLGYTVISNDVQYYAYVIAKHFIENCRDFQFQKLQEAGIQDPFFYLNTLDLKEGYIFRNYTAEGCSDSKHVRNYFTSNNGKRIDTIRGTIEDWRHNDLLSEGEYFYLLACLIEAADKVANTASVYEAFLKKIKKSAEKMLILIPLDIDFSEKSGNRSYNMDGLDLLKVVKGDILYMDPPYNERRYDTNYHILETIARNDSPNIKGKTGIRDEKIVKSKWTSKVEAPRVLDEMLMNADFKYILLSYNDEGIIPLDRIEEIMKKYGTYHRFEREHKRFKADSKREYLKERTVEYLHCLIKEDV